MKQNIDRRNFLKTSVGLGLGLVATQLGCHTEPESLPIRPEGWENFSPNEALENGAVQKGPFVQFLGRTSARLRFETRQDEPTYVDIERQGKTTRVEADRDAQNINYGGRPMVSELYPDILQDVAGLYVLHTVIIEGLKPNEPVTYTVHQRAGEPIVGSFTAPPASQTAFRLGWVADTMSFINPEPIHALANQSPDIIVHGGDIVYDTSPMSSWNSQLMLMAPLLRIAAIHFCVGNHEFEPLTSDQPREENEIFTQFDRLFSGQGAARETDPNNHPKRYHTFDYGSVRVICLDSETHLPPQDDGKDDGPRELTSENSEQLKWLDQKLAEAAADTQVQNIVVAFHRPVFSWSKYGKDGAVLDLRNALHQRFLDAGVSIVLNGHMHAFEYFEVDGIQYITDGGGGALLVNPNENQEAILDMRPEEADFHLHSERNYGAITIDFEEDGSFTVRRLSAKSEQVQFEKSVSRS